MAPGPGRPATPSTDGVLVAAIQKTAAETRSGVPGEPARSIVPFMKHCWFSKTQVSPGSQNVQLRPPHWPLLLQVLNFVIEQVPSEGPFVQIPSSAESVSKPFTRQSPWWQNPFGASHSLSSLHG